MEVSGRTIGVIDAASGIAALVLFADPLAAWSVPAAW